LLAYIDDRLSAENAKEIGQQITRSPFASELAQRIRDVVRRRRLAAPDHPHPMIDPNLVAEYLDDQLTPDLVARMEQETLRSDSALAEVAATHAILGLLREPVQLEQRLRERLYAMDPSGRLAVVQALREDVPAPAEAVVPEAVPVWKPPEVRRQSFPWRSLMVIGGIAAAWLFIVYDNHISNDSKQPDNLIAKVQAPADPARSTDGSPLPPSGPDTENNPPLIPDTDSSADTVKNTVASTGSGSPLPPTETVAAGSTEPETHAVTQPPENPAPEPADTVAGVNSPESRQAGDEPAGPETDSPSSEPSTVTLPLLEDHVADSDNLTDQTVAATDLQRSDLQKADAASSSEPDAVNQQVHRIFLVDEYRTAILLKDSTQEWTLAHRAAGGATHLALFDWRKVLNGAWIGVSKPYRVRISADGAGWNADTMEDTICRVINEEKSGIAVLEGRIVVSCDPAAGNAAAADPAIPFLLRTGRSSATVKLLSPGTQVAIEVRIIAPPPDQLSQPASPSEDSSDLLTAPAEEPAQKDQENADSDLPSGPHHPEILPFSADVQVSIYVSGGAAELLLPESSESVLLAPGAEYQWKTLPDGSVTPLELPDVSGPRIVPDWVLAAASPPLPEQKNMMTTIADSLTKQHDFIQAALKLTAEKNSDYGVAAVNLISLTQDVEALIQALQNEDHEPVRRAAIDGLQKAANQTAAGREVVRNALVTRLPMSEVPLALRLIVGVTEVDARDPVYCAELIRLLSHDRLYIRELAVYRMVGFSGKNRGFGYSAKSDAGRRRDAIRRWQRHLDSNNGQLIP
jgi:hypothetical protein